MESILKTHSVTDLKKEISKTNIKGYSKMKKDEVIKLMLKNQERFKHIKTKEVKPRAKPVKKEVKPVKKPEVKPVKKPENLSIEEQIVQDWNKPISNILLEQKFNKIFKTIVGVIEKQKLVSIDRLINIFGDGLMTKLFNKYKGQFVLDGLIRFVKYNDNYNRKIQFDKFKDYFITKMYGDKLLTTSQTGMKMSIGSKSGGMSERLQKVIRDNWKKYYENKKEVKKEEVKKEVKKEPKKIDYEKKLKYLSVMDYERLFNKLNFRISRKSNRVEAYHKFFDEILQKSKISKEDAYKILFEGYKDFKEITNPKEKEKEIQKAFNYINNEIDKMIIEKKTFTKTFNNLNKETKQKMLIKVVKDKNDIIQNMLNRKKKIGDYPQELIYRIGTYYSQNDHLQNNLKKRLR